MPNPTHMLKMNLQRAVTYIDRLPLFTRLAIVLMVAAEIVGVLPWWDLKAWGRLEPDLLGLSTSMLTFFLPAVSALLYGGVV